MTWRTTLLCGVLVLAVGCSGGSKDPRAKKAKETVQEAHKAMMDSNYAKLIDLTHPAAVKMLGGKEKAIETVREAMEGIKGQGLTIQSMEALDPEEPVTSGAEVYVVVPCTLEMKGGGKTVSVKSFYLGISSDKGETWTFLDGSQGEGMIRQVLPNLPADLKLPKPEQPKVR